MGWGSGYRSWGAGPARWGVEYAPTATEKWHNDDLAFELFIRGGGRIVLDDLGFEVSGSGSYHVAHFETDDLGFTMSASGYEIQADSFGADDLGFLISGEGAQALSGTIELVDLGFTLTGYGELEGDCIVMCLETGAVTLYRNFRFNSLARINGTTIGAADDGIYDLEGDGTVDAHITTPQDHFDMSELKSVPECFLALDGGPMEVQVIRDGVLSSAKAVTTTNGNLRNRRAKFGRGGRYSRWGLKISNKNGADFTLEGVEMPFQRLSRKINE